MVRIAQVPAVQLATIRTRLENHFKRSFSAAEFKRVLKEERARARDRAARRRANGSCGNWRYELLMNEAADGTPTAPKPCLANAVVAVRNAEDTAGRLAFNEFSQDIVALTALPWGSTGKWTDTDNTRAAVWLQQKHRIMVNSGVAAEAAQAVARERTFHPVREYLDSLRWDGTERAEQWLPLYLGAKNDEYTRGVGLRWLISAVARIYQPGAKVDCCLVLEGPQGLKKSTALNTIAGEWFADELAEMGTKDAALQTQGVWILELAELDSLKRTADISRIKSFMSRKLDHFRPPYGRTAQDFPRQCVFAGTINPGGSGIFHDETGNRRFWPVECTHIRIQELARDRDQIWAEAVVRYRRGDRWWIDNDKDSQLNDLAQEEQALRYEGGQWDELILKWLENPIERFERDGGSMVPVGSFSSTRDDTTINDILLHCIGKAPDKWTQADRTQVAKCLKAARWNRHCVGPRNAREWRYHRAWK
jgi:putative DNA primase/helicase